MANSVNIQKITNETSSNYCKMPDGTLIQWGHFITSVSSKEFTEYIINFNPIFTAEGAEINVTPAIWGPPKFYPVVVRSRGMREVTVRCGNESDGPLTNGTYSWIAIGRWK